MTIRRRLRQLVLVAAACAATAAGAQQEIKITVCAGQAPVFPFVRLISQSFIPSVNADLARTGKLKITWNEAYGGTLAKIGGELEAVQQGVCDISIVSTIFHPAKMPLQQVTFMAPFGPTDLKPVVKVMNDMNRNHPLMRQAWERHNQVFLAGTAADEYALFSNFPAGRYEDLNGRKIGSSPVPLSWLKGTGATGVAAGLPSYYNDMKSGVYAGVLTFLSAAAPTKLMEVAPYYIQTGMGATFPGALSMNRQAWDRLGPEGQSAVRAASDAYVARFVSDMDKALGAAEAAYKAGGGRVLPLPAAERERWARAIENPAKAWIAQNGQPARDVLKAYMDAMRAEGIKFARDWDRE